MGSVWAAAGVPGDQVRQTADKLLAILKDPQLKGESTKSVDRMRGKLQVIKKTEYRPIRESLVRILEGGNFYVPKLPIWRA